MLKKLASIALALDKRGLHKEADDLTNVMARIAQSIDDAELGAIDQEFEQNPDKRFNVQPGSTVRLDQIMPYLSQNRQREIRALLDPLVPEGGTYADIPMQPYKRMGNIMIEVPRSIRDRKMSGGEVVQDGLDQNDLMEGVFSPNERRSRALRMRKLRRLMEEQEKLRAKLELWSGSKLGKGEVAPDPREDMRTMVHDRRLQPYIDKVLDQRRQSNPDLTDQIGMWNEGDYDTLMEQMPDDPNAELPPLPKGVNPRVFDPRSIGRFDIMD